MSWMFDWIGPAAGMNTPSRKMPTLGSMPGLVPDEPMPRIRTVVLRLLLAEASWTLGICRATESNDTMPARSRLAPLKAETAIATSCRSCVRFAAVTIRVSTSAESDAAAGAAAWA